LDLTKNLNSGSDSKEALDARSAGLIERLKTSETQYSALLARYSPEKIDRLIKALDAYKYGLNASAPIICLGPERCPFFYACPIGNGVSVDRVTGKKKPLYDSIEDFPVGNQCILEKVFIEQRLIDYVQEFSIDPARPSELALINDLALVDLYKQRCTLFLAGGDKEGEGLEFMKKDLLFNPETGEQTGESNKEHPVMSIMDRLEKRRHKILEELIATRKSKADIAAKFTQAPDASKLLKEIELLRKVIDAGNKIVETSTLTVKEQDSKSDSDKDFIPIE
jgi:hypothetical protein